TDPRLAPLGNYGGPTKTPALLPGSPPLDAGPPRPRVTADQRGAPRPPGGAPPTGALRAPAPPPAAPRPRAAPPPRAVRSPPAPGVGRDGAPGAGAPVTFRVPAGPNAGAAGMTEPADGRTDAAGQVRFTYLSMSDTGTDTVLAAARLPEGVTVAAAARVTWF